MCYPEVLSYNEDSYRSGDWSIVCASTFGGEVDAVWCFAFNLKGSSCGVVEVLVQQL